MTTIRLRTALAVLALGASGAASAGEPGSDGIATEVPLDNGNVATIHRQLVRDSEGNTAGRRHVTVTDVDGNVVYRGGARGVQTDDGARLGAQRGTYVNEHGETVTFGRRGASDGNGNAVRQRGARVTDADGNVIAAGRDAGINRADGRKARSQKRVYTDADGNRVRKVRQGRTDGDGNSVRRRGRTVTDADGHTIVQKRSRSAQSADGRRAHQAQARRRSR